MRLKAQHVSRECQPGWWTHLSGREALAQYQVAQRDLPNQDALLQERKHHAWITSLLLIRKCQPLIGVISFTGCTTSNIHAKGRTTAAHAWQLAGADEAQQLGDSLQCADQREQTLVRRFEHILCNRTAPAELSLLQALLGRQASRKQEPLH